MDKTEEDKYTRFDEPEIEPEIEEEEEEEEVIEEEGIEEGSEDPGFEGLDVGSLEMDDVEFEDDTSEDDNADTEDLDSPEKDDDEEDTDTEEEDEEDLEEKEDQDTDTDSDEDTEEEEQDDDSEESEEGEESEEPRIIDELAEQTGLEFEEGELEEFDDSREDIVKFSEKVAEKRANQRLERYLENHPMTKKLVQFEEMGGDPDEFRETFFPETDYTEVEVPEDDPDTQKKIIRDNLKKKGFSEERIERNLEMYEDGGVLQEEAKDAVEELREEQEKEQEELMQRQQEKFEQAKQQAQEVWNNIQETVNEKTELNNIPLPAKDKDDFLDFISPDEEEGVAPRDKKIQEMSIEDQLTIDLILYYGTDKLADIINRKAKTKKSGDIKKELKKKKKKNKSDDQTKPQGEPDTEDLEFRLDE